MERLPLVVESSRVLFFFKFLQMISIISGIKMQPNKLKAALKGIPLPMKCI